MSSTAPVLTSKFDSHLQVDSNLGFFTQISILLKSANARPLCIDHDLNCEHKSDTTYDNIDLNDHVMLRNLSEHNDLIGQLNLSYHFYTSDGKNNNNKDWYDSFNRGREVCLVINYSAMTSDVVMMNVLECTNGPK